MTALRIDLVVVLLIVFAGTSVMAEPSPVVKEWAATLETTSGLLARGEFEDARRRLERLTRDMTEQIGPGEAADRLLGIALGQLAVAEAGAGATEDAVWHWHIAQNVLPAMREVDLSAYGNAAELLRRHILPPVPERCAKRTEGMPAPVVTKRVEPKYPEGARKFGVGGIIIVQVRIDEKGRVSQPLVLRPLPGPLVYTTLDALRQWRFELPAPNPEGGMSFCITIHYKLK